MIRPPINPRPPAYPRFYPLAMTLKKLYAVAAQYSEQIDLGHRLCQDMTTRRHFVYNSRVTVKK